MAGHSKWAGIKHKKAIVDARRGKLFTKLARAITVVRPELPFGVAVLDSADRVTRFREKPRADHWVNGGFFACDARFADYLGPDLVLEREPLERLAADGDLHAYRHNGFWACMDTYKDAVALNDLWAAGDPPWLR